MYASYAVGTFRVVWRDVVPPKSFLFPLVVAAQPPQPPPPNTQSANCISDFAFAERKTRNTKENKEPHLRVCYNGVQRSFHPSGR